MSKRRQEEEVTAFKATNAGGRPNHGNEVYKVGMTYTFEGTARLCGCGYHASQRIKDVFTYYEVPTEIYEVSIGGSTDIGDDKICGTEMTVERQLSPLEIVKMMEDKSKALPWAARKGHKECVEFLIPLSDPKAMESQALRWAAANGHREIVELLLLVSNPKAYNSSALRSAAMNGHKEIVALLIPVSDPKACESGALRWAADRGHKEIVELLIPLSDPKACDSAALRYAAVHGHKEIVELLIPVSEPAVVSELGLA